MVLNRNTHPHPTLHWNMPCSANEVFPCLCSQWHQWQRNNDSLRWSGLLHHEGNARWNISVQQIFFNLSKFQPDSVAVWGNPPKSWCQLVQGPGGFLENPHDFAQTQPWALKNIFKHTAENPDRYLFENPRSENISGFPFFFLHFPRSSYFPVFSACFVFLKMALWFFSLDVTHTEKWPLIPLTRIYIDRAWRGLCQTFSWFFSFFKPRSASEEIILL